MRGENFGSGKNLQLHWMNALVNALVNALDWYLYNLTVI
jgi:hypothetical protein